ncbi:MAG: permease [Chloroflexi bacterium]|nr:permease [Chloroflexota bacterium]
MLAGHFGLAAVVKSRQPQLPLWALMLSTQLLDVIFVVLYTLNLEGFTPVPGTNGGYGNLIIHANYSHSLVGAFAISLVAAIAAMIPWGRSNGLIVGAMVFSHWLLDLLVHRMDMPVLPGNAGDLPLLGFGIWTIPGLSIALELILILAGAFLYYHAAMRSAVRAERQDAKAGVTVAPKGYRNRSLLASVVLLVLMVGTLVSDLFGLLG